MKWEWVRLSTIAHVQDPNPSHRMRQYVQSGGIPFSSSENFVEGDQIDFQIGKQVTQKILEEQIARFSILVGALAFTRIGTIGKSRFARGKKQGAKAALPRSEQHCRRRAGLACQLLPLGPSTQLWRSGAVQKRHSKMHLPKPNGRFTEKRFGTAWQSKHLSIDLCGGNIHRLFSFDWSDRIQT